MSNQNELSLNGKIFRKAVVTATWSKWYKSEILVLNKTDTGFVYVLCEDGKCVIMNVKDVSYLC